MNVDGDVDVMCGRNDVCVMMCGGCEGECGGD